MRVAEQKDSEEKPATDFELSSIESTKENSPKLKDNKEKTAADFEMCVIESSKENLSEQKDNKKKAAVGFEMCVIESSKEKLTDIDDYSTVGEDLDSATCCDVCRSALILPCISSSYGKVATIATIRATFRQRFISRSFFQRWLIIISQFLVCILTLVFGIAQFSNLVPKPLFCGNVDSFDVPSSAKIGELLEQHECLQAPGLYHLGDELFKVMDDQDHITPVSVQWSKFNINSVFTNLGTTMSQELRSFIALIVAFLAARSCWESYTSKIKLVIPWRQKKWYCMPSALWSHIVVENMVKMMIFGTLSEIILQFIKFLHIGGVNIPMVGRVDEVAPRNVISYLAIVIGINLCTEGFCWSIWVCNWQFEFVEKTLLHSILVVIDLVMDVFYLCTYFVDIEEELGSGFAWYDYLVCLSESNTFLYFAILIPIFRISGALRTLDAFWCAELNYSPGVATSINFGPTGAHHTKEGASKVLWKSPFFSAIFAIILLISLVSSGIYLIVWTESHLARAAKNCDNARFDSDGETFDYTLCSKGKLYTLEPIDDYELSNGEKLYCDCKYSEIFYTVDVDTALGFLNRMRSLRWVTWINQFQASNGSLITWPNLQVLYLYFVTNNKNSSFPYSIDVSASQNIHTLWIDFHEYLPTFLDLTVKTATLPKLEVFFCTDCTLLDFDPCESPNLKNLRLEYSTLPPLGPCFADLSNLKAFIVRNTYLKEGILGSSNIYCHGECLQELPELPSSLVFLILNHQNITEIANWDIFADIEMVSLWGNPACGIYNSIGDWRNLTGKAKYCTMMASDSCVAHFQDMVENCDRLHLTDSEDWESCRLNIINGTVWSFYENCTACERDVEFSYLCEPIPGCSPIAYEVDGICAKEENSTITQGCDDRWVDERTRGSFFFTCDTACLDLYPEEEDDCQPGCSAPNDVCNTWWSFAQRHDGKPTIEQSSTTFNAVTSLVGYNNYDPEFQSMNSTQRFNLADIDKNGFIQGDAEIFWFARNLEYMAWSQWGYENRWHQQSCSHCYWYSSAGWDSITVDEPTRSPTTN